MKGDSDDGSSSRGRRSWLRSVGAAMTVGVTGCGGDDLRPCVELVDPGEVEEMLPPAPRTHATFEHGVASGDPLAESVILWTRISHPPAEAPPSVDVAWEVALDAGFARLVAEGVTMTDADRDWTVKVDADGLGPGTTYYFRFWARGEASPTGRTRTAPRGAGVGGRLRFAVASCASLGHGFFHVYRAIARRADLDAVIHLGDYIYEYASGVYGQRRAYEPGHELLTLGDYRMRYAQYRRDPDLAEAHRQHPWIVTWDDHEIANDAWAGGAENHQEPSEGSWADRLAVAVQAHREWMPIREAAEPARTWRSLDYGDLCELIVLDGRIWGRDPQVWTPGDPALGDPDRELLGADQHAWLFERLQAAAGRWKLIAQQVLLAPLEGFPNPDQWNGYPAARGRLLDRLADEAIEDVVVLTGDIHSSWAFDLAPDPFDPSSYDPSTGAGAVGVELVCPGVSSPGFPDEANRPDAFLEANPHLLWVELQRRGYVVLDLADSRAQADWFFVGDPVDPEDETECDAASFVTARGASHLERALAPASPRPDPPDLA